MLTIIACSLLVVVPIPATERVECIGAFTVGQPPIAEGPDWPMGGLSAIDWHISQLWAASDDRAEFAPARLGVLDLAFSQAGGRSAPTGVTALRWHEATDEHGRRFVQDRVDPEGIRVLDASTLFWSSEGRTALGETAAVFRRSSGGGTQRLPLPEGFTPDHPTKKSQTVGVRNNRGFEALALERGEAGAFLLYAGLEEPLAQDESDTHTVCRVVVYGPDEGAGGAMSIAGQRLYPLGPAAHGWEGEQNGLTELVSIGPGRLLAMERAERVVGGTPHYNVRLYEVDANAAADASDPTGYGRLGSADLPAPMTKRLVLDFDAIADQLPGGRPKNFEGMTLLPGRRLLVVSDNDHGVEGPTVFVTLQLPPDGAERRDRGGPAEFAE